MQASAAQIQTLPLREDALPRPWWRPTLPMLIAFSGGLWIGAMLGFANEAAGVGLILGILGLAIGGARLLGQRLRQQRLLARAEALERDGEPSGEDDPT